MFRADVQLDRLSKLGDPLKRINEAIDWEKKLGKGGMRELFGLFNEKLFLN